MSTDEATRLIERHRDEYSRAQISNAETYDRYILLLSSTLLGFSLTFIGQLVDMDRAIALWLLIVAWSLFALSIAATIFSIMVSQSILKALIDGLEPYFLNGDTSAKERADKLSLRTHRLNQISGTVFMAAVALLIAFAGVNVVHNHGGRTVQSNNHTKGAPPNTYQPYKPDTTPSDSPGVLGATPSGIPAQPTAQPEETNPHQGPDGF